TPGSLGNGEYIQNSVAGPGFGIGFYTTSSQKMVLTGSGNLGIGTGTTSLPTERLDVAGNVKFSGALMPNNNGGAAGQYLISQGTGAAPVWTAAPTTTFAYSQATGSLTSGTFSAYITPNLSVSGSTLTVGPASNSVNLSVLSPWTQNSGTVALATSTGY